jgi:hypothetical protein
MASPKNLGPDVKADDVQRAQVHLTEVRSPQLSQGNRVPLIK